MTDRRYKRIILFVLAILVLNSFISITTGFNLVEKSVKRVLESTGIYTEQRKKIELKSKDWDAKTGGAWKIDKSVEWTSSNTVKATIAIDTMVASENQKKDILFVLDVFGSHNSSVDLTEVKAATQDLTNYVLENDSNRVAYITSDNVNETITNFTNNIEEATAAINSISYKETRNYTLGVINAASILSNYTKEEDRDVVILFLTDGYPTEDTPNQIVEYEILKDRYPYVTFNAIQYETGSTVLEPLTKISDNQFIADKENIKDIMYEAALSPKIYENLEIFDSIANTYFDVNESDIKATFGEVNVNTDKKITWNLENFISGRKAKMTVNLTLKEPYASGHGYYPIQTLIDTNINLLSQSINNNSTSIATVLKNYYTVSYDTNPPNGCNIKNIDTVDNIVYQNVDKRSEVSSSCPGYLFKGWEVADNTVNQMNEDTFIMPEKDVTVRATWTSVGISKSMDGTIYEKETLWKRIEKDAQNNRYGAKVYTGEETADYENPIYYYTDKTNNNVIFGNFCWQIVRTTETGGIKLVYNGTIKDGGCDNSGTEQQLADKSVFNNKTVNNKNLYASPAGVGYMYNTEAADNYVYKSKSMSSGNTIYSSQSVSGSNNYYFSTSAPTYSGGTYTLTNPVQLGNWSTLYSDNKAKGYYTCFSTSSTGTCSTVHYVTAGSSWSAYTLRMSSGQTLSDVNTNIILGTNFTQSGSNYTLTGTKTIKMSDWSTNYADYKNYYMCSNKTSTTCTTMYKLVNTTNYNYIGLNIANGYRYGSSFTYSGGTYTLTGSILVDDVITNATELNTHHYTCLSNGNTCTTLAYVYYLYSSTSSSSSIYYIELKNGKSVDDALNEMLWNDEVNQTDSDIKKVIDSWYSTNMTGYTKYLENTIYCNDRSIYKKNGWDSDGGNTRDYLMFRSSEYWDTSKLEDLTCVNKNDQFTVNDGSGKGNGKLTYPVGLLTASEAYLIGGNFAKTGQYYWLLSPYDFNSDYAIGFRVNSSGYLIDDYVYYSYGVRPSVSLLPGTEAPEGDGSVSKPYVIDTSS